MVRSGLVFAVLALCVAPVAAQVPLERLEEEAFRQAAAVVDASVVRIDTVGGLEKVGNLLIGTGPTTGLIVSSDGLVISSTFNFVSKPASILVTLADGRRFPARQVAEDKSRMLTLLKIDAADLPVPQAAPRSSIRVGEWALALGRTFEGGQVGVSVGIVSAVDRVWGKAVQTDAKVSPVNYGGPLVDIQGRVLGVLAPMSPNEAGETVGVEWYDSGIGFAVPLEDVFQVLDRLKTGENLLSGLMGITFEGESPSSGETVIDRVRYRSPAEAAGFKTGDKVVEADGAPVATLAQLKHVLGRKYAGETIQVVVARGEERLTAELKLVGELPPFKPAFLGILPARLKTGETRAGVEVRYVYADSPAGQAGLKPRDLILKFGDKETPTADALLDAVGRVRAGEKATLVWKSGDAEKSEEVTLVDVPDQTPAALAAPLLESAKVYPEDGPPRGRITEMLAAHNREYWAYIPENYNPAEPQGLVVWLHPAGDTMEADIYKQWKTLCDRRGLILLGPKAEQVAGWTPNDAEFVTDLIADFRERYTIDPHRVVIHGHASGGPLAWVFSFKNRELVRGCSISASPLPLPPPENDPAQRLQFHLLSGADDATHEPMEKSAELLRQRGYPVSLPTLSVTAGKYPTGDALEDLARWVDALDRI